MNAEELFVGAACLAGERWVVGGTVVGETDPAENFLLEVRSLNRIVAWRGEEITSCGAVGGHVVCPGRHGRIYLFDGSQISTVEHDDTKGSFRAISELSLTTVLIGGTAGRFLTLDLASRTVSRSSLGSYGISGPGRDILCAANTQQGTIVAGKGNLLVMLSGDAGEDLLSGDKTERMFFDVILVDETVWAVGLLGLTPILLEVPMNGAGATQHSLPFRAKRSPAIARMGADLVLASESIIIGKPGAWRDLGHLPSASATALVPDESSKTVQVIGYTGVSWTISI